MSQAASAALDTLMKCCIHRDRTESLDRRNDLTGRLVRLMTSVYFSNSKVGAGELLFALCGQDREFSNTVKTLADPFGCSH